MRKNHTERTLRNIAVDIRKDIVRMHARANASHIGSALSTVEMLVALYFKELAVSPRTSKDPFRDRFILSKGHGGAALYATLAHRGFFPRQRLQSFCANGGVLPTHPVRRCVPGVEATTGSLGHGLPLGIGMALAARMDKKQYRTYVMLSDGECDEGSVWEAFLYAGFHKLDNLTVLLDYNKIQSFGRTKDVLDLEPLHEKLEAFRWCAKEIDGHDFGEILSALRHARTHRGKPHVIIAHTVKGRGVSFMEDQLAWHYKAPSGKYLGQALRELEIQYEP